MRRLIVFLTTSFMTVMPAFAQNTWGQAAQQQEKGFSWTDPLWPSFWMAWTPATLVVFIGIFSAMGILTVVEIRHPGGNERRGALGLVTTRGDRLFLSLLGSTYIFLAWLGLFGLPLWAPLALAIAWSTFCFWKV